ncbi:MULTISPECIES: head decoration protein [Citrobacter freundii complex]|uniref:head decoration protein n=1 Tax=Citrobacter freundii complex TaxID=1344959 RepID=UPI0024DE7678|nr:head decoration protein [Citrobacter portucalensis]MDK2581836.1 head decoration protein [Citrobacter portucalensis]HBU5944341.1 head decoration protein [Citrobacter freundii]HDV9491846.1 head decoration protein [Citrobacter freundii]
MQETFTHEPDNLVISGGMPAVTININVASGIVERGTLLSFVSIDPTTNVVTVAPIDLTSANAEEKLPFCIAQHHIDASKKASRGTAWATGMFNSRKVILPAGVKVADVYLACRKANLFLNYAMPNPAA